MFNKALLLSTAISVTVSAAGSVTNVNVDIGVYGSTVCAVTACVAAARMNASCAIVESTSHLFGMSSGGLSSVDKRMNVGGIAREIFGPGSFPHIEPHVRRRTGIRLNSRFILSLFVWLFGGWLFFCLFIHHSLFIAGPNIYICVYICIYNGGFGG